MTPQPLRSIYQLKVTLKGARPPIWRRFQISSSDSLEELHLALQIVMGWDLTHLHEFSHQQARYGIPDDDFPTDILDERNYRLGEVLKNEKDKVIYDYDFGDGWRHDVVLEKILPFTTNIVLPICIKGKRACPPEDIGGLGGYENFLQIIADPSDPEYEETLEWIGSDFDAEYFDLTDKNNLLQEFLGEAEAEEDIEFDINDISDDNTLDFLDQFLLYRFDDDADTTDKDEGILCLSELDGFFTAIISGPELIPPSKWLPAVWGDFEPEWDSTEEFQGIFGLLVNIMNSISTNLMEVPEKFEACFTYREIEDESFEIVDEWCEGYWLGVSLALESWEMDSLDMTILLTPILAFSSQSHWKGHEFSGKEYENLKRNIIPNTREIHAYWLARRTAPTTALSFEPQRRNEPKTGRNDPCPCGSGKKYKKCCLH